MLSNISAQLLTPFCHEVTAAFLPQMERASTLPKSPAQQSSLSPRNWETIFITLLPSLYKFYIGLGRPTLKIYGKYEDFTFLPIGNHFATKGNENILRKQEEQIMPYK